MGATLDPGEQGSTAYGHIELLGGAVFRGGHTKPVIEFGVAYALYRIGIRLVDNRVYRDFIYRVGLYFASCGTKVCASDRYNHPSQHGGSFCSVDGLFLSGREDVTYTAGWLRIDPGGGFSNAVKSNPASGDIMFLNPINLIFKKVKAYIQMEGQI